MKKISIDLDDLDKAIGDIDELIQQIESFPTEVANNYRMETEQEYATFEDPTAKPISVAVRKKGKTSCSIVASGKDVGFAEYGTGIGAEADDNAPIPTGFGSWSSSADGKGILVKTRDKSWHYGGYKHFGYPATRALRNTTFNIKKDIYKLAEEHFK